MSVSPQLPGTDLAQFIRDGHLVVKTSLPDSFHRDLHAKIEDVFEKEGNPGNNILPRVPEIASVYDDPAVRSALQSLLGPGYIMNPHRHCHLNPPGSKGQSWHKDCYVFDHNVRHPRFHWVLAFYYPQDVTPDMGPTGVMPKQQWYQDISDPDPAKSTERDQALLGVAGTVSIVHFDAWHRATANTSDRKRYMLKFQFARTAAPEPVDAAMDPGWESEAAVSDDVWAWLHGGLPSWSSPSSTGSVDASQMGQHVDALTAADPQVRRRAADALACSGAAGDAVTSLRQALTDDDEGVRLNAAYALAAAGAQGRETLVESLRRDAMAAEERALAKTADNAHGTNPTAQVGSTALGVAPDALDAISSLLNDAHWLVRASAVDAVSNRADGPQAMTRELIAAVDDDHWWVRRNAQEALGRGHALGESALVAVSKGLRDEDYRVRRNAAMALRRADGPAGDTVDGLKAMLHDENRYNRFYAIDALRRLAPAAAEAERVLMDHLYTSRWCPLTDSDDRY
ncbi:MAG: hypothetical protein HN712_27545 [Gemmatimonadetes bacterium]|nr:hypothetical protein [Gemmatimonadota bacterium]MBT7864096.1 hypothetical protein [Gemmatimonadota bacterium]